MKQLLTLVFLTLFLQMNAQDRIDSSFSISPISVKLGESIDIQKWTDISIYSSAQGWLKVEVTNDTLSTRNLQSGVYFVTGEVNGQRVTEKLLVF